MCARQKPKIGLQIYIWLREENGWKETNLWKRNGQIDR